MVEFFHMGGYAAFVWPAYGAALLVAVALIGQSLRDYRAQARLVETLERSSGGRVRRAAHKSREEDVS